MTALPLISEPITTHDDAGLGCLATGRGNLPLDAVEVDAQVTGLLHATRVRQTFVNPHDEPLEATYIFPLPDRAAVTSFRMEVADRVVEGVLQERAEARKAYDDAIAAGQRAAIAEEERPNVFTVRVGNLMPNDRATVELTLAGPLALDSGEATWRFPLVVAPRYIPGTPLPGAQVGDGVEQDTDAVPDASRISPPVLLPGFPNPVRLAVRVDLDAAGLPVSDIRSTLPAEIEGNVVTVRPGQRLDRDLVIRFTVGADSVGTSLVAQDGTFALTLVPPTRRHTQVAPRDVVFVLDRSGSMDGWKMTAARRAVARMIDTLGPDDRFAVLAFDDRIDEPPNLGGTGLQAATDRLRFRAVEFLATLGARGGTEMLEPLRQGVSLLSDAGKGRERVLVLATDGQVGNEDQILAAVGAKASGVRIFTVGIDTAVNDAFLRRLAAAGGGACEVVESEDRLDEVMERIHRRIGTPVLTGVAITAAGLDIDADSLAPARIGALHAGAPLSVLGRYRGKATGAVRVTATDASGKRWSTEVSVTDGGSGALTPVWARARIRDLEDRYVVSPDPATEREIVRTSLDGKVLSRFTAFVAVDVRVVNEDGVRRKVTQPVDAPHGWDMFGAFDGVPAAMHAQAPAGPAFGAAAGYAAAPMALGGQRAVPAPAPMAPPMQPMPSAMMPPSPARRARFGGLPKLAKDRAASVAAKPAPAAEEVDLELAREKAPELDLTPYRERATALVERFESGALDAGGLRLALTDLVDDLRSVGVADAEVAGLRRMLEALEAGTWAGDLEPLREFAAGSGSAGSGDDGKRRAFWKR